MPWSIQKQRPAHGGVTWSPRHTLSQRWRCSLPSRAPCAMSHVLAAWPVTSGSDQGPCQAACVSVGEGTQQCVSPAGRAHAMLVMFYVRDSSVLGDPRPQAGVASVCVFFWGRAGESWQWEGGTAGRGQQPQCGRLEGTWRLAASGPCSAACRGVILGGSVPQPCPSSVPSHREALVWSVCRGSRGCRAGCVVPLLLCGGPGGRFPASRCPGSFCQAPKAPRLETASPVTSWTSHVSLCAGHWWGQTTQR